MKHPKVNEFFKKKLTFSSVIHSISDSTQLISTLSGLIEANISNSEICTVASGALWNLFDEPSLK